MDFFDVIVPGEIYDRLTILYLEDMMLDHVNVSNKLNKYKKLIKNFPVPKEYVIGLFLCNAKIWNLESDIRLGKENKIGLEEVGKRAIQIREINTERWKFKNKINALFNIEGEPKVEWKYPVKYVSEYLSKELRKNKIFIAPKFVDFVLDIIANKILEENNE